MNSIQEEFMRGHMERAHDISARGIGTTSKLCRANIDLILANGLIAVAAKRTRDIAGVDVKAAEKVKARATEEITDEIL